MGFKPSEKTQDRIVQSQSISFHKEQFVEDVFNDSYILVVGSGIIMDAQKYPPGDVNQYILDAINKTLNRECKDFNELADVSGTGYDAIRNLLNSNQDFSFDLDDMSPELRALMETRLFPIVLTTTFDGYLETLMKSIWGDRLRVVNIDDKKTLDELRNTLVGYRGGSHFKEPTLFYIFGKAVKDEAKKYVRTDDEAIQIIEKWIMMPKEDPILSLIKGRKLLALGCKFEDWYFRFFWYVLRRDVNQLREGQVAFLLDESDKSDRSLKRYLEHSGVYHESDARRFMSEATTMLSSVGTDNVFRKIILENRRKGGVFLSYCSEDVQIVGQVFMMLHKDGYNVWFDNARLMGGDSYDASIREAISAAKIFIPVLSPQIVADYYAGKTNRYYFKEWSFARQWEDKVIIPLAVNGFNLRDNHQISIFEEFFNRHVTGIDLMGVDGSSKLKRAIDNNLKIQEWHE